MFLPEPLGGVKNLQVTDPTTSSLKVRWDPAEGNVRQYRIFYVPTAGGAEDMVRVLLNDVRFPLTWRSISLCVPTGAGFRRNHQHRLEEPSVWHSVHCNCGPSLPRGRGPTPDWRWEDTWVQHCLHRGSETDWRCLDSLRTWQKYLKLLPALQKLTSHKTHIICFRQRYKWASSCMENS